MALIKELNIEFEEGLNILTGETGAGKSIIIKAINIILGGHASVDLIREEENILVVEGLFCLNFSEKELINGINPDLDIVRNEDALLIRRELNRKGRNKCWANGRLINLTLLQKIGKHLVDLHGQHNHQSLLDSTTHIDLMDNFGGENTIKNRSELFITYRSWKEEKKKLSEIIEKKEENAKRVDYLKYQLNEIEEASLIEEEDKDLEEEETVLRNAEKIISIMEKAIIVLYEGNTEQLSVRDSVNEISSNIGEIENLDHRIEKMREDLKGIGYHLEDLVSDIIKYRDKINLNQERLKAVEERLNIINNLKSKYGNSIEEILTYRDKVEEELLTKDYDEAKINALKQRIKSLEQTISELSMKLSDDRKEIAKRIEKDVIKELSDLKMKNCRFKVSFVHQEDINGININGKNYKTGPKGIDLIEFMISPNLGENLRPLARIVSGGEVSRIMLALKSILSEVDRVPTLIFDEIDSGVGARLGEIVAEKLKNISKKRQVICVTHLPQIASKAQKHFFIEKQTLKHFTEVKISEIHGESRIHEIARMLDGNQINRITIQHAKKMLNR